MTLQAVKQIRVQPHWARPSGGGTCPALETALQRVIRAAIRGLVEERRRQDVAARAGSSRPS